MWIMVLMTAASSAFGMWMLDSGFSRMLRQERQQASQEILMFQYFLEVGYQSGSEYGDVYALRKAIESIEVNADRTDNGCVILDDEAQCYLGEQELERLSAMVNIDYMQQMRNESGENNYVWQISMGRQGHELIGMCDSLLGEKRYYLLVSRNIQSIYDTRETTVRQYRIMLLVQLAVGAVCAWLLARHLTRPVRQLGEVAGQIAGGAYDRRSDYHRRDEVGELAESFNIMADRLVEQMQEKEQEARRQEDFTAAFAHELKTPLTSIIGYSQMLDTMKLKPEERRTASHYIYTQGKRLEQLSHKLLELVSMEKQDFTGRPVSAKELGKNLWTTMRPIWERRRIRGKIRMEQAMLWGDEDLLLSLLYNLLDNAAKAVEDGGQISLEGHCVGDRRWYGIRIRDNGRGIPREEISRITEPFYMVDKSRSRKEGGAGLGMSLCRKILELHGGSWKIKSTLGQGTEILIRLPLPERTVKESARTKGTNMEQISRPKEANSGQNASQQESTSDEGEVRT